MSLKEYTRKVKQKCAIKEVQEATYNPSYLHPCTSSGLWNEATMLVDSYKLPILMTSWDWISAGGIVVSVCLSLGLRSLSHPSFTPVHYSLGQVSNSLSTSFYYSI